MTNDIDLRQLAIDRGGTTPSSSGASRLLLSRYLFPASLIIGVFALIIWSAWDIIFPPTKVTVVPVLASTAQRQQEGTTLFNAAGWIEPRPTPIRAAALAPGVVKRLLVVEDQALAAGEPVAHLVDDDARLAHDRALAVEKLREAQLQKARAALVAAKTHLNQPVHLQAELGAAEAALAKTTILFKNLPFEIRRAESRHQLAQDDLKRKQEAEGVISKLTLDKAKTEQETALAMLEELAGRGDSLKQEHSARERQRDALRTKLELLADETKARDEAAAEVVAAEAMLKQARVAVAEAKLRLDRMIVRAPVDGRVLQLVAHPGASLSDGMGFNMQHDGITVITMYQPKKLQVRVDVRFKDLSRVRLGQKVTINNPAIAKPLAGEVLFVSSVADIQKNTLEVKVAIIDPPPVFKPQMLVDVVFLAAKPPEENTSATEELRLFIPKKLLVSNDTGTFVWVADQSEGVARRTAIKLGTTRADGMVEVTKGLNETSRIIVSGTESLRDGQRIKIVKEAAEN